MSLRKQTPSDFLKQIIGRPVVVKLNSGVDYRGKNSTNVWIVYPCVSKPWSWRCPALLPVHLIQLTRSLTCPFRVTAGVLKQGIH